MRKIIIVAIILINSIIVVSAQTVRIDAEIIGYPFDKIYVRANIPNSTRFFDDTISVKSGRFEYDKSVASPLHYTFVANDFMSKFEIFVSGGENVKVKADYSNMRNVEVEGSDYHKSYIAVANNLSELQNNLSISKSKLYEYKVEDNRKKGLHKEYIKWIRLYAEELLNIKYSKAAPYYLFNIIDFSDLDFTSSLLLRLDKGKYTDDVYYNHLMTHLNREVNAVEGAVGFNFNLEDIYGKKYTLDDFKGKFVLLEFSASWCGWCKKEIPYIKQIYDLRAEKNIEVITINMDDKRELWEKESNSVEWLTLSDLKAYNSPVVKGYNVTGIPQIYIIDKDGTILTKNLRGDNLVKFVKNLK